MQIIVFIFSFVSNCLFFLKSDLTRCQKYVYRVLNCFKTVCIWYSAASLIARIVFHLYEQAYPGWLEEWGTRL